MTTPNPYAAPKAPLADASIAAPANFTPGGRSRAAAAGWRWIAEAWPLFMKAPGTWIGIVVVMLLISFAANFIPLLGPLALTLLTPVFAGGIMLGCRALDQGQALEFRHLFAGFQTPFAGLVTLGAVYLGLFVAIMIVVAVISGAGMFAMVWGGGAQNPAMAGGALATLALAMLLGLALFVPVAMLMWFAPALVVLNHVAPTEALKQSWSGCLKNMVPFLLYGVILLVASIVASLPFMLGWLALGPVMAASIYTSYRDIYLS